MKINILNAQMSEEVSRIRSRNGAPSERGCVANGQMPTANNH